MGLPRHIHDPNAVLDYPIKLSDFTVKGDPATAVTAASVPVKDTHTGVATIENVWPLNEDGIAAARVTGANMVVGESYILTFHFELESGQEDDRSEILVCKER
jgi:hypothetical protein